MEKNNIFLPKCKNILQIYGNEGTALLIKEIIGGLTEQSPETGARVPTVGKVSALNDDKSRRDWVSSYMVLRQMSIIWLKKKSLILY